MTIRFASVVYVLAMCGIALGWLTFVIVGMRIGVGVGMVALLFGWIPGLFYLILVRVGIEVTVAVIRTAENTSEMVRRGR